jgi:hypothetical protein
MRGSKVPSLDEIFEKLKPQVQDRLPMTIKTPENVNSVTSTLPPNLAGPDARSSLLQLNSLEKLKPLKASYGNTVCRWTSVQEMFPDQISGEIYKLISYPRLFASPTKLRICSRLSDFSNAILRIALLLLAKR